MSLTNSCTRTSTVITLNDCELVTICKEDYDKVIKKIETKKV